MLLSRNEEAGWLSLSPWHSRRKIQDGEHSNVFSFPNGSIRVELLISLSFRINAFFSSNKMFREEEKIANAFRFGEKSSVL